MMLTNYIIVKQADQYAVYNAIPQQLLFTSNTAQETFAFAVSRVGNAGGQIGVGPGEFILDSPITLANNISLRGSGRGTRLLVSSINQAGVGILCENLVGVEIGNLTISGKNNPHAVAGLVLDGCGDCTVHDVFCVRFAQYGMWIRNETILSEIRGCSLAGNGQANIFFDKHRRGQYGDFIPNLLSNCKIYGGGKGIDCLETTVLNINACLIYQTRDIAIHIRDVSYSVLVTGCRTFQIGSDAVVVENTGEFNLSSNILCWHTGHGVIIRNCGWGTIAANEIIDSGSYNAGVKDFTSRISDVPPYIPLYNGISLVNARGFNVTGNTIFNWPQARKLKNGIFEDSQCRKNSFVANNINYYGNAGIDTSGTDTHISANVLDPDRPHDGNPQEKYHQSFMTQLTDAFIDDAML
ncbi:MAG: right-handed parallel beta-helix repeat-containing protein [Anaerolineae bacterium]|nr:right-handed parallel beta-helix repeat-containing protein [Anaerolineae bacterium]